MSQMTLPHAWHRKCCLGPMLLTIGVSLVSAQSMRDEDSPEPQTSRVSLRVVDTWGRPLPYRVDSFVNERTKQDYSAAFLGLSAARVPDGEYWYRLVRIDAPDSIVRSLKVRRGDVAATIIGPWFVWTIGGRPVDIDTFAPRDFQLEAEVELPPECERPWLRLQSALQNHAIEATVDGRGHAAFREAVSGLYIAILSCKDRVASTALMSFDQGVSSSRFRMPLGPPPEIIRVVPKPAVK